LWWNQIWETLNAGLKALFVFLLTPLMIQAWGKEGFGQYAVASSLFILLTVFDFGIRPALRVNLAVALGRKDSVRWNGCLRDSMAAYAVITTGMVLLAVLAGYSGAAGEIAGLGPGGNSLVVETVLLSLLVVFSQILLEPLMVYDRVGIVKFASAAGMLCSLGCVLLVVRSGWSVGAAVAAWLLPQALLNILACFLTRTHVEWWQALPVASDFKLVLPTIKNGVSYNFINTMWLAKTHGLTLVVAHLAGEAEAGVFFLLLRLSELIGILGAVGVDAGMAPLARAINAIERHRAFILPYRFSALCMGQAALVVLFFGEWVMKTMHLESHDPAVGMLGAIFGLSIGLNRILCVASMSLGLLRICSILACAEAFLTVGLAACWPQLNTVHWCVWAAVLASSVLVPLLWKIAGRIPEPVFTLWIRPLAPLMVVWGTSWVCLQLPVLLRVDAARFIALGVVSVISVLSVQLFRKPPAPSGS